MFTNLTWKLTYTSWIPYLPVSVTKRDSHLSNLREYWEQSHVLTLISVLLSLYKIVASNHTRHKQSVACSYALLTCERDEAWLTTERPPRVLRTIACTHTDTSPSLDKTVASYRMLHKQSDACSYASYSQFCYWAIDAFWNYALYHNVVILRFTPQTLLLLFLFLLL